MEHIPKLLEELERLFMREIATLERELELYPDDSSVWRELPGLPNPAGTLFLHLSGNLQHHFGMTLGGSGYVRDRAAEFSRRSVSRNELKQELSRAKAAVCAGFANLSEDHLTQVYPVQPPHEPLSTRLMLLQFSSHLAYHLGQIDFHRRMVTGDSTSANAIAVAGLVV